MTSAPSSVSSCCHPLVATHQYTRIFLQAQADENTCIADLAVSAGQLEGTALPTIDLQQPLTERSAPCTTASPTMPPSAYMAAMFLVTLSALTTQVQNSHIASCVCAMATSEAGLPHRSKALHALTNS